MFVVCEVLEEKTSLWTVAESKKNTSLNELSKDEITFPDIFISILPDRGGEVLGLVYMCVVLLSCIYNLLPGFWVCSAFKFCTKCQLGIQAFR